MSSTDSFADAPTRASAEERANARGWAVFAAVMLLVIGGLDALWGLAAILNNEVVVVGGHGVIVADISTWGWVTMIFGLLVALTGLGLLLGNEVARWAAIFLIAVGVVLQLAWFPAAPLWTLLIVALSIIVIYQLTAHWAE
ncbi:MAG TPA: hypothetical protein VN671_13770 [Solirubrobacterales bacterium]|nr:hypothetical protein [Solirubrobacterales bacterium]